MRTLLSLFDYTGQWSQPYLEAGWNVIPWDIKFDLDARAFIDVETTLDLLDHVDGILAAPPCTDFTVSGAQYWSAKDQDGRTEMSKELIRQVLRLVDLFEPTDPDYLDEGGTWFWVLENPVGRLPKLFPEIGKPVYFDPCDFAGYLNLTQAQHNELDRIRRKDGVGVTREEVEFVLACNAYTKKTGLWGCFEMPTKKRVEPVRVCKAGSPLMILGGKSDKTKAARSVTPPGFAKAFYNSNQ